MRIVSSWTKSNSPLIGLTPAIRVINATTGLIVADAFMTEFLNMQGSYYYDFIAYDPTIDYLIRCDSLDPESDNQYTYSTGATDASSATAVWDIDKDYTFEVNSMGELMKEFVDSLNAIDGPVDLQMAMQIMLAVIAAKSSGGGTDTIRLDRKSVV